jgi:hypothetical protein
LILVWAFLILKFRWRISFFSPCLTLAEITFISCFCSSGTVRLGYYRMDAARNLDFFCKSSWRISFTVVIV